nr:glycosyltransferase [Leuconostoc gelidum]
MIVINKEDYALAVRHLHTKYIDYQAGVGINYKLLQDSTLTEHIKAKNDIIRKFNLPEHVRIIVSVGELSARKNHRIVLEALQKLGRTDVHYIIAGKGRLLGYLQELSVELNIADQIHFLNYTTAIRNINLAADVAVLPSLREGLSRAGLESIRDGAYLLGADIRGIKDYILNDEIGQTFNPRDSEVLARLLSQTVDNKRVQLGQQSINQLMIFDRKNIDQQMYAVYQKIGMENADRFRDTLG